MNATATPPKNTAAKNPTYVAFAQVLGVGLLAAPALLNLWLLRVLPWGWVVALTIVSAPLTLAIFEDVRDLYAARRYGRRNARRAALKAFAWSLGFLPGLLWVMAADGVKNAGLGPVPTRGKVAPSAWDEVNSPQFSLFPVNIWHEN